jgi:hypothetical protein
VYLFILLLFFLFISFTFIYFYTLLLLLCSFRHLFSQIPSFFHLMFFLPSFTLLSSIFVPMFLHPFLFLTSSCLWLAFRPYLTMALPPFLSQQETPSRHSEFQLPCTKIAVSPAFYSFTRFGIVTDSKIKPRAHKTRIFLHPCCDNVHSSSYLIKLLS